MNVLQLITPTGYFGAERWIVALAQYLDPARVRCDLVVTREGKAEPPEILEHYPDAGQTFCLTMSHSFDPSIIARLCTLVRERKIDVIHSHGYKSDTLALIAARRCGVRCISTPHGFGIVKGRKLRSYLLLGRGVLRRFDRVVPLSPALVEQFKAWRFPGAALHYIANGVDTNEIEPYREFVSDRNARADESRHRTIGYVGRLANGKQVDQLILAFDKLSRQRPHLRLQIVGDGALRDELMHLASTLASAERIEFTGFRPDRFDVLSRLDCFVMTSSSEGVPRSMMEAMAMGVPVVAYDIPGVNLLVTHDVTGLLAPLDDVDGLADRISRVLADSTLASRLTEAAHTRIQAEFSARAMAERYTRLYESMSR